MTDTTVDCHVCGHDESAHGTQTFGPDPVDDYACRAPGCGCVTFTPDEGEEGGEA